MHDVEHPDQGLAHGVMAEDQVDAGLGVPVQGMGQQKLGRVDVDADHDPGHVRAQVAVQDAGVGEGVEQAVLVVDPCDRRP